MTGKIKLRKTDSDSPEGIDREEIETLTSAYLEKLGKLQTRLYAEGKQKLLIILHGMDASGKDSCIRNVIGAFNPEGVQITSFKQPEPSEAAHDFLWRCHIRVPAAGQIGVFNRSYYEEVLVVRVNKLKEKKEWKKYYGHINDFEQMLSDTGTHILKFYLHISEKEQKKRLEERISDPEKNWKYKSDDWKVRKDWPEYMKAYEELMERCSPERSPWHIIPADDKWYRNHCMAKIILEKLEDMDPKFPLMKSGRTRKV